MELLEQGKDYWTVMSRVRKRGNSPLMLRAAVSELYELLPTTSNPAVKSRMLKFIAANRKYSPSDWGGGGGPRRA
jgi:hypothetical protein